VILIRQNAKIFCITCGRNGGGRIGAVGETAAGAKRWGRNVPILVGTALCSWYRSASNAASDNRTFRGVDAHPSLHQKLLNSSKHKRYFDLVVREYDDVICKGHSRAPSAIAEAATTKVRVQTFKKLVHFHVE
jgi:hypothetical protein